MIEDLKPLLSKFMLFAKDRLKFQKPPRLFLKKDDENGSCMLGKTAHYDPNESGITLFISKRHPKDIMRSLAHELVHHCQNERGDLSPDKMKTMSNNYAQENDHMRKMEEEAYLQGNMCFRDWEDGLDDKLKYRMHIAEHKFLKENKKMSVKITKKFLKETITKLLDKRVLNEEDRVQAITFTNSHLKDVISAYEKGGHKAFKEKAIELAKAQAKKRSGFASDKDINSFANKLMRKARKDYAEKYEEAVASFRNKGKDTAVAPQQDQVPQKESTITKFLDKRVLSEEKSKEEMEKEIKDLEKQVEAHKDASLKSQYSEEQKANHKKSAARKEKRIARLQKKIDGHKTDTKLAADVKNKTFLKSLDKDDDALADDLDQTSLADFEDAFPKKKGKDAKVAPQKKQVPQKESKVQTPEQENKLYESRFTNRNTKLFEKLLKEWTK